MTVQKEKVKTNKFDADELLDYAEKCIIAIFDEKVIKKPSFNGDCICRGCDKDDVSFERKDDAVDESNLRVFEDKCATPEEKYENWKKVGEDYSDLVPYLRGLTREQLDKGLAKKK